MLAVAKQFPNGHNGHNIPPDLINHIQSRVEKRKIGAVSKCTPELCDKILYALEGGATKAQACKQAGISVQSLWAWEQLIPAFSEAIAQALKAQVATRIDATQDMMEQTDIDQLDPKLAMAHLRRQEQLFKANLEVAKRRDPATWGDKQINVNVNTEVAPADLQSFFGG